LPGHFSWVIITWPGTKTWERMSFIGRSALFISMAMPDFIQGETGSLKCSRSKDFPKHVLMVSILSLSRCVSCSARIAILFPLRVLLILAHLSMRLRFAVGVVAPLIFSKAIVMFALFFIWCLFVVWPGVGR
jgi:hypothetical protein